MEDEKVICRDCDNKWVPDEKYLNRAKLIRKQRDTNSRNGQLRVENCGKCDSHHTLYYEKDDENGKKKSFWHCLDCESEWTTDIEEE